MSKMDEVRKAKVEAMKAKDKARKEAISSLISAVKKAGIDAGCREDIPEEMVNSVILKELKKRKDDPLFAEVPSSKPSMVGVQALSYSPFFSFLKSFHFTKEK